jgi:hypothetical protein
MGDIYDEAARLRHELRLSEAGLANATQEIARLHNDLTACQLERERLRAALKRYGRHTVSCPATGIFAPPEGAPYCTCGFEAITAVPQSG